MTPRTRRCVALLLLAACAGYEKRVENIRGSLERGDGGAALAAVNQQLGVKNAPARPSKWEEDTALLLLERAMILQSLGRYEDASRDLEEAERHLELLDLTKDTAGDIGKYLYSDDATVYKAPGYEKLLLSTENLVNYLARGDLEGARVEARRLTVMRNYLRDEVGPDRARFGLGSYLAGFAFEKSGRPEEALRHYEDALEAGPYPSLGAPIARLASRSTFRGPRLDEALRGAGGPADPLGPDEGELLVVLQSGLVPRKVPERVPIGLVVSYVAVLMTPMQAAQAQRMMAKGAVKWLNFPKLVRTPRRAWPERVSVDGQSRPPDPALEVAERVVEAFEAVKPKLMLAAVTRLLARWAAGEIGEEVVKKASGSGVVGLLAGLAVEGAMTAKDTPDTRSWTTLPAEISLARVRVPAGTRRVRAVFRTAWGPIARDATVEIPPGGFRVVSFFEPR